MSADLIRQQLADAREELGAAAKALAPKHVGGEWTRYDAAAAACIALERSLSRELGEECAVRIPWQPLWDIGAPLPHVVASDNTTLLIYLASQRDAEWDGTSARVMDPASDASEPLALVSFDRCISHRFGAPNNEVLAGHPLNGKGLEPYAAHIVERSSWIAQLQAINSVHTRYDPSRWTAFRHFLLAFHDNMFEAVAVGFSVEVVRCSFSEALKECVQRVVG